MVNGCDKGYIGEAIRFTKRYLLFATLRVRSLVRLCQLSTRENEAERQLQTRTASAEIPSSSSVESLRHPIRNALVGIVLEA